MIHLLWYVSVMWYMHEIINIMYVYFKHNDKSFVIYICEAYIFILNRIRKDKVKNFILTLIYYLKISRAFEFHWVNFFSSPKTFAPLQVYVSAEHQTETAPVLQPFCRGWVSFPSFFCLSWTFRYIQKFLFIINFLFSVNVPFSVNFPFHS